jgi:hypothetical protein
LKHAIASLASPAHRGLTALCTALLVACSSTGPQQVAATAPVEPLYAMLASDARLEPIVRNAEKYRLLVILGMVQTGSDGRQHLVQDAFGAGDRYFYPASAVKLLAAVAALERLRELRRLTGLAIDVDTPLVYYPLFPGEERVDTDRTNVVGGKVTVRHEIRKLFLVSDNEAFNRLYELVGQDQLAALLARAGLPNARIVHRLEETRTQEENRRYPRIDFVGEDFQYSLAERSSASLPPPPPMPGLAVGTAYMSGDQRIEGPMDFSSKNRIALADLQRALCAVVLPHVDCGVAFDLSSDDRVLLMDAMHALPRESENPVYPESEYPDEYVKYFLPGLRRVFGSRLEAAPTLGADRIDEYNKIGQAYGFTTENAWIVDEASERTFFLAATLYANEDGVLNDDHYDYDSVALPFLADLAEVIARRVWSVPAP